MVWFNDHTVGKSDPIAKGLASYYIYYNIIVHAQV